MQVDRMCSAEAAITIKQNKQKQRGGHLFNERVIVHCLTCIHSFKSSAINERAKGNKKKRTCRRADGELKEKKDEHLKLLLSMPRTILFYKNQIKK